MAELDAWLMLLEPFVRTRATDTGTAVTTNSIPRTMRSLLLLQNRGDETTDTCFEFGASRPSTSRSSRLIFDSLSNGSILRLIEYWPRAEASR